MTAHFNSYEFRVLNFFFDFDLYPISRWLINERIIKSLIIRYILLATGMVILSSCHRSVLYFMISLICLGGLCFAHFLPVPALFSAYFVLCVHFIGGSNDALYRELWHACAGPLVTLPREGERVYYFPQGHMEQVC